MLSFTLSTLSDGLSDEPSIAQASIEEAIDLVSCGHTVLNAGWTAKQAAVVSTRQLEMRVDAVAEHRLHSAVTNPEVLKAVLDTYFEVIEVSAISAAVIDDIAQEDPTSGQEEETSGAMTIALAGAAGAAGLVSLVVVAKKQYAKKLKVKLAMLHNSHTTAAHVDRPAPMIRIPSMSSFRRKTANAYPISMERDYDNENANIEMRKVGSPSVRENARMADMEAGMGSMGSSSFFHDIDLDEIHVPTHGPPPPLELIMSSRTLKEDIDHPAEGKHDNALSAWGSVGDDSYHASTPMDFKSSAVAVPGANAARGRPLNVPKVRHVASVALRPCVEQAVARHTNKLLNVLDANGDGIIGEEALASYLHIKQSEAMLIIAEAKKALHTVGPLTRDEFSRMLHLAAESGTGHMSNVDLSNVPVATLGQYERIFNTLDMDKRGLITVEQLAQGLGGLDGLVEEDNQQEFAFADFATLLHRAESGGAGRVMAQLLADTPEGALLLDAIRRSIQTAEAMQSSVATTKPEAVPQLARDIWEGSKPDSDTGLVEVHELQQSLMAANTAGDLVCTEDELLLLVLQISQSAANGLIDFVSFWATMGPSVEEADHGIGISQTWASSVDSSVMSSAGLGGLAALTVEEQHAYARAFDMLSRKDGKGVASSRDMATVLQETMGQAGMEDASRLFFFHLMGAVTAQDDDVDFTTFACIVKDAEVATGHEMNIDSDTWAATDAMATMG